MKQRVSFSRHTRESVQSPLVVLKMCIRDRKYTMITVDAMGDNCPIPVIKTKKAMDALTGPETIEVLVLSLIHI